MSQCILIIDDEPDILEFLQIILVDEGYEVAISDKDDYLNLLQQGSLPDLILLDMLLSGRDGREIVRDLKRQPETRSIPVVMFSAHPSAEEEVLQAGADDFLAKPFGIDELLAKVERWLSPR
jgi:DNA-binding response OmpR family regulator